MPVDSAAGLEEMEQRLLKLVHLEFNDDSKAPYDPSYFLAYREMFFRMLRFQVHETQDDPLLCLFVLHTDLISGYAWKERLQQLEEELTPKVKACLASGAAVRHVVFVGDLEGHREELRGIDNTLKASTRFPLPVSIYFDVGGKGAVGESIGGREDGSAPGTAQEGAVDLASFVEIISSTCILPHIESRIRELEVVISASRRGLKNQLKSLLFRKTPSEPSMSSDHGEQAPPGQAPELSSTYAPLGANSVEAAMRHQSDLLMLVGDYTTATATLKLLSSDLKADKLHLHYASSQESLALSTFEGGGSVSAAIMYMKEAFLQYSGIVEKERGLSKSLAATYCTRVALQWASLLASLKRVSEASWIVMRAHFHESNLRAAFLLEYAAHFLLQQRPAKERKCGFYLVLAALRYGQARENSLAFVAHQKAIGMLHGKGWDILEEHVHEALDHEYTATGNDTKALKHAVAMLQCFSLPSQLQASHMAHMLSLYAKVAKTGEGCPPDAIHMGVPVLDTSHAAVICAGSHDYYDDTSRKTSMRVWKDMELDFPRTKSAVSHGRHKSGAPGRGNACVGEDILVKITISNPLKIPLEAKDIELICDMRPHEKAHVPSGERAASDLPDVDTSDLLVFSTNQMFLGPGEEDVLELKCRAQTPASVSIRGVRWSLGGVPCEAKFEPQVSKWSLDPDLRPSRGGPIEIDVMPPMPRLHVAISPETPCPDQMLVGELVRCELTLSNIGSTDLQNVECVASNNVFLEGTEQRGEAETCHWYKDVSIAVGQTKTINVYLRPEHAGHQDFHIIWRYQPVTSENDGATGIRRAMPRYLRFSKRVVAQPSLLESQVLIVDHAADDNTDMACLQARTTRDCSIRLDSLIISSHGEARTFDLRGISALPSSGSPTSNQDSASASYEFDDKLSSGKHSQGLANVLAPEEAHFLHSMNWGSASPGADPSTDPLRRVCGVLRWYTDDQHARTSTGFTVFPLTRSTDAQTGLHGSVFAQLIAPASLQHNFAEGPLTINVELQIQSKIRDETVDATWLIGNTPLGAVQRRPSHDGAEARKPLFATSKISWKGEPCGMQLDIKPDEKRFVIMEATAKQPGTLQLDAVHVQWHSRADPTISGSITLPVALMTVKNVRPAAESAAPATTAALTT